MSQKQHAENLLGNKPQDNEPPGTPRQRTLNRKYKGVLATTDSGQGIGIQFSAREY
jgi:hypothetical protein